MKGAWTADVGLGGGREPHRVKAYRSQLCQGAARVSLAPRYLTSASGTMPAPGGLTAGASLPFKQKPSLPESLLSLALRYER